MRRRDFLATAAVAIAGWRLPPRLDRVGLQLYTARSLMAQDLDATLATVAEIGYREVEFAGYFGRTPDQIRSILADVGLAAPATHVDFGALERGWDATLDTARVAGHRYVVVPWIPNDRRTLDGYRRVAHLFEQRGAEARAAGLVFAYHNHDFEFADVGGTTGYDVLCDETSAGNVVLEMDLFWTVRGGRDPLDYFARYPRRFPLVHVKDMDAQGRMVDPGQGRIDFAAMMAARETAGIRHWFVEHDQPTDVLETLRQGHRYLRSLQAP